jgi:hypothetical protein
MPVKTISPSSHGIAGRIMMVPDAPTPTAAPHSFHELSKRGEETRTYVAVGTCVLGKTLRALNYPDPAEFPANAAVAELIEKWWVITRSGIKDGTCHAGFAYKTDNIVSSHIFGRSPVTSLISLV